MAAYVAVGTQMRMPLAHLEDWTWDDVEAVYGGVSMHVLRSRMSDAERAAFDARSGLPYGTPDQPRLSPLLAGAEPALAAVLAEIASFSSTATSSFEPPARITCRSVSC